MVHSALDERAVELDELERALVELCWGLCEALMSGAGGASTAYELDGVWSACISACARGLVLSKLLSSAQRKALSWAQLWRVEALDAELSQLSSSAQVELSREQSQQLRAWRGLWEPSACHALGAARLSTQAAIAWSGALSAVSERFASLKALHQALSSGYERLIRVRVERSAEGRLQLSAGGLRADNASYYTPPLLIEQTLDVSLSPLLNEAEPGDLITALDPSCGVGGFLLSALERLARHDARPRAELISSSLYGVDIDPHALELCRVALWLEGELSVAESEALAQHIRCGDALLGIGAAQGSHQEPLRHWRLCFPERCRAPGSHPSFELIVGNPPYIDSEQMKRALPRERRLLSERFVSCKGNWDLFVPFVELSYQLLAPGGAQAMVTPKQLISADYAAALHGLLLSRSITHIIDCRGPELFLDADVEVLILAARRERAGRSSSGLIEITQLAEPNRAPSRLPQTLLQSLPRGHWGFALHSGESSRELFELWRGAERLGALTQISDGATTSEAYQLKELISEASSDERSPRALLEQGELALVNTGLIDPFERLWGARRMRYLKSDWAAPVVSLARLKERFPRRAAQALQSKVLVAGLARRVEAVVAPPGVLCGKSARQLLPQAGVCPYALSALLNSQLIHELYGALFGLRGLARSWSVGSKQLAALPCPRAELLASSEPLLSDEALLELISESSSEPITALEALLTAHRAEALSLVGRALHLQPHNRSLSQLAEQRLRQALLD